VRHGSGRSWSLPKRCRYPPDASSTESPTTRTGRRRLARTVYFEVVTTPAGYHARIVDKHDNIIFRSKVYSSIERARQICQEVKREAEDADIRYVTES
jgi:Domain of unknown function (DUF1508)